MEILNYASIKASTDASFLKQIEYHVEAALTELNVQKRTESQAFCEQVKQLPNSLEISVVLFHKASAFSLNLRYFGLLMLEEFCANWNALSVERRELVKRSIFSLAIEVFCI